MTNFKTVNDVHNALRIAVVDVDGVCRLEGVVGQPMAFDYLPFAIMQHLRNNQVRKPLVAILAGDTGIGKSTFERALRAHVLFRSTEAGGVTVINGADYNNATLTVSYRDSIRHRIADAIMRCSHSFILLDDIQYMASGVLDNIDDFLGPNQPVHFLHRDGRTIILDCSRAIFFMTTNNCSDRIAAVAHTLDSELISRTQLTQTQKDQFVQVIKAELMHKAAKITWKARVDHFIPFLPITVTDAHELVVKSLERCNCETKSRYSVAWSEAVPFMLASKFPTNGSYLLQGLTGVEDMVQRVVSMRAEQMWSRLPEPREFTEFMLKIVNGSLLVQRV